MSETRRWSLRRNSLLSVAMAALQLSVPEKPKNGYITLEEVSWHDNEKDCWVILYDRVYNISKFLHQHPGGYEVLMEHAGRDATVAFRGAGHSITATNMLKPYLVGELPPKECIFRSPEGIRISGIPL